MKWGQKFSPCHSQDDQRPKHTWKWCSKETHSKGLIRWEGEGGRYNRWGLAFFWYGKFISLYPPLHPSCVENPCCPASQGGLEPPSWQHKRISLCNKDTGVMWDCHWYQVICSMTWHKWTVSTNAARKAPWHILRDVARSNPKCSGSPCLLPLKCLLWEMKWNTWSFISVRKWFVKQPQQAKYFMSLVFVTV